MRKPAIIHRLRILSTSLLLFIPGCATDPVSLKVENSLPPDKLSYYSDTFDTYRDDLWDKSAVLYKASQMTNFQLADMNYQNGKLIVTTKKDCFSKASLNSKFSLQGDFDIQLDCHFSPLRGYQPMDQVMVLIVIEKGSGEIGNLRFVNIGVSQNLARSRAFLYSYATKSGGGPPQSNAIQNFHGSLRMVRDGRTVTTYYKQRWAQWKKLRSFPFSNGNLIVGFAVQNFTPRTSH